MDFYGDYHTHSPFSHGKATIAENAAEAAAKGFKEIAVTDHGFRHVMYNAYPVAEHSGGQNGKHAVFRAVNRDLPVKLTAAFNYKP